MDEINLETIHEDLKGIYGLIHDGFLLTYKDNADKLDKRLAAIEDKLDAIDARAASIEANSI